METDRSLPEYGDLLIDPSSQEESEIASNKREWLVLVDVVDRLRRTEG